MKRVICFSVFMVIAMIMTTSCTKCTDDPTPTYPAQVTSIMNLSGSWEFVNFKLGTTNFTTCEQLATNPLTIGKPYLMSFDVNSVTGRCILKDKCINPTGTNYKIVQTYIYGSGVFSFDIKTDADVIIRSFVYSSYIPETGTLELWFALSDVGNVFLTVKKI